MPKGKILVVDDEESIRDVLQQLFTRSGYAVRLADSGGKGLKVALKPTFHTLFFNF